MNKKVAIALIVGVIFSIITALISREYTYYVMNKKGSSYETNKESYDRRIFPTGEQAENRLRFRKKIKYNNTFILVSLIGGIGVGFLGAEFLEKKKSRK